MRGKLSGSFRDHAGFVFRNPSDGSLLRQVNASFRDEYDHLLSSGLYEELVSRSLLIPHEEAEISLSLDGSAYRVLRPETVEFISYPYEWCFGQLKDAALATLEIQTVAMEFGMSLRDASAYNIQFHRGLPTLIDTLSFERLPEGKPWIAYRQLCQHFLAPLALMAHIDARLIEMLRGHIDGIPLDLASSLLAKSARMRPGLSMHIHSHAKAQSRYRDAPGPARKFSKHAFMGLIESLRSTIERMEWKPRASTWSDYYDEGDSYTARGIEDKKATVSAFLDQAAPSSVWDLGANVGVFSRLASDRKVPTVAFDIDYSCIEANYRQVRANGEEYLLPLYCDLVNPSPAIGWETSERDSLIDRGPADLVIALALVHHVAIGNNVPLLRLASFLARLGRWLIVEFVPKEDPKVQLLLRSREDIFGGYTKEGFEEAFRELFEIVQTAPVADSARILYLMRGR